MNNRKIDIVSSAIILGLLFCFLGCNQNTANNENKEDIIFRKPNSNNGTDQPPTSITEGVPLDMVLIYEGGSHRTIKWDTEHFAPYVSTNVDGKESWLFDGFLFLEIHDGKERGFASGYKDKPARKTEWEYLLQNYFKPGNAISALNDQIENVKKSKMPTADFHKRKVVISIPEPIPNQTDWGKIGGKSMNFSKKVDRIAACKWYISFAEKLFAEAKLHNLELTGFYWLAERATETRDILKDISGYLNSKGYDFYWIPYFSADGYSDWRWLGFDVPYYQPNYFFNDNVPFSRLKETCKQARDSKMNLEVEFDENVLVNIGNRGYKLHDYLDVFESEDMMYKVHLAYYQGGDAFYRLSKSTNSKDRELYERLVRIIAKRKELLSSREN